MGVHQKIDRTAYKYLSLQTGGAANFPKIKDILHFEGKNGPDGIKTKSPAKDEPWHYYDPFDEEDTQLLVLIKDHYDELVKHLKKNSLERASFDSAWLAHAIVDGLTPAHHYPYEAKLTELRGGDILGRTTYKEKLMITGDNKSDTIKKNWALWGVGGVMSAHMLFEMGIAMAVAPVSMKTAKLTESDIDLVIRVGHGEYFKRIAREIALLDMYEDFLKKGWNRKLIRQVRNELGPIIIKTVAIIWYSAMRDAGLLKGKK